MTTVEPALAGELVPAGVLPRSADKAARVIDRRSN